jgi:hypothetical protein
MTPSELEEETWRAELELRREEIALKRREADRLDAELELKRRDAGASRWNSPLVISIIAATLAGLANVGVSLLNAYHENVAEKAKEQSARILEMIKTNGDTVKSRENISFLTETGLVDDPELTRKIRHYLAQHSAPSIGATQRPITVGPIVPDPNRTPGEVNPLAIDANVCEPVWQAGTPPALGGHLRYSPAARDASPQLKVEAFYRYGLDKPDDGGSSFEVDNLVPLSLGGLTTINNLWPETRTAPAYNAWTKDALEIRLFNLICHRKPGDPKITLAQAQQAMMNDWTKAYDRYCGRETDCPFGGQKRAIKAPLAQSDPNGSEPLGAVVAKPR